MELNMEHISQSRNSCCGLYKPHHHPGCENFKPVFGLDEEIDID
jgi:hypothetical protein